MTPHDAAELVEGIAKSVRAEMGSTQRQTVVGAIGIGTAAGGPGIVGIAQDGGVGFKAVAVAGDQISRQGAVAALEELAEATRAEYKRTVRRLYAELRDVAALPVSVLGMVTSALTLANLV